MRRAFRTPRWTSRVPSSWWPKAQVLQAGDPMRSASSRTQPWFNPQATGWARRSILCWAKSGVPSLSVSSPPGRAGCALTFRKERTICRRPAIRFSSPANCPNWMLPANGSMTKPVEPCIYRHLPATTRPTTRSKSKPANAQWICAANRTSSCVACSFSPRPSLPTNAAATMSWMG